MEELTHKVQYRRKKGNCDMGWHTMAAFDCEEAAKAYAKQCSFHVDYEYRVVFVELNDVTWGTAEAS